MKLLKSNARDPKIFYRILIPNDMMSNVTDDITSDIML